METEGIRQRPAKIEATTTAPAPPPATAHPGGDIRYGPIQQAVRVVLLNLYFLGSCICMHISQWLGAPLYFYDKDLYYAWMALIKQHFTLLIVTMQAWWSSTLVRISGDESVRGQLRETSDGRLELDFPERIVLLANHQIYTDWLYLWWSAYAANMHGHLYIILKESLKYIPLLGPGMMFFSFVFLSRNWAQDKPRFQHRLKKLTNKHKGLIPGSQVLDPMWLLLFPEGTNISKNGRAKSKAWAEKSGQPDLQHCLLPRSTGLLFCLEELGDSIDWVYDCTLTYEGVPRGQYGQDIYTMKSIYLQGRNSPSVNMHWRRFAVADIPKDAKEFDHWLTKRWQEKDALLEHYAQHGRFPADEGIDHVDVHRGAGVKQMVRGAGYVETHVRPKHPLEFLQIFAPVAALGLIVHLIRRFWNWTLVAIGRR